MTNLCHNRMKITGPISEITRFKQTCIRTVYENEPAQFDFNAIDPMPDFFGDKDALPYKDALKAEFDWRVGIGAPNGTLTSNEIDGERQ